MMQSRSPGQKKKKRKTLSRVVGGFLVVFLAAIVGCLFRVNLMFSSSGTSSVPIDCISNISTPDTIFSKAENTADAAASATSEGAGGVMNDSSTATVMGMATGYNLGVYQRFVGSLRRSGFRGNIILVIAEEPSTGVEEYLASKGVTMKKLKKVPCTTQIFDKNDAKNAHDNEVLTCADPYPYLKIRWGRFPLLRDYLQECQACTGPVLVTDVRDAFFQRDPFGDGAPIVTGLQVFEEAKFQKTTHWLVKGPVSKCKGGLVLDEVMLCSGTTIGTREAMLEYLEIMHQEMAAWMKDPKCCCNKMNGDDQSIHNYLFYTGKFPFATAVQNRMGIVHTVGKQAAEIYKAHEQVLKRNLGDKDLARTVPFPGTEPGKNPWLGLEFDLVDSEGFFLDYDGSRSRVVHQWDRFRDKIQPWLKTNGLFDH
eukprot:scaffold735_cov116-Cylindrotheca_fusiformis.AAC.11